MHTTVWTNPIHVMEALLTSRRFRLAELPQSLGLYALYDHDGEIRYIGETANGFHDRIFSRHSSGSDDGRQKFVTEYASQFPDRSERIRFVRENCRATIFEIPAKPELIPAFGKPDSWLLALAAV